MKKYVMLIAFTAMVLGWLGVTPKLTAISVTGVNVFKADYSSQQTTVEGTGSVIAKKQDMISYGYAIKTSKIYVDVGDKVTAGQKLIDIDTNETAETFKTTGGVVDNSDTSPASSDSLSSDDVNSLINQYYSLYGNTSGIFNSSNDFSSEVAVQSSTTGSENNTVNVPEAVYASLDGVVTQISAQNGGFVSAKSPLIVVTDLNSLQVIAQIDESLIKQVKVGQKVNLSGTAFTKTYMGTVSKILPTARTVLTTTGSKTIVDIQIDIENIDDTIKPGFSTNVIILISEKKNAIFLPYDTVMQDEKNIEYVYVIKNGRISRQNITTGAELKNTVEVLSGINLSDSVVINPPANLKNGQYVRIKARVGGANA
jgi:multidrug efflux pump subunit AcrA (membrane-fusion protein)